MLLSSPIPRGVRGILPELTVGDAETFAAALRACPGHRAKSLADCLAHAAWLLRQRHWADETPPPALAAVAEDARGGVRLRQDARQRGR